ncbi:hypothetical protein ACFXPR_02490 [Nocardia tengchongensis]|uniref:hypothetical protein n=1 Tax=Nocardia tengchongensis TaxID=2055889 RepID=UPI00368A1DA4
MDGLDVLDPNVLDCLRASWQQRVHSDRLPWYAVAKLQLGGAATFVGVDIDTAGHRYQVSAVGDACLLHVRRGRIFTAGPLDHPRQFGRTPPLITTHAGDQSHLEAIWQSECGYAAGDHLLLASDALAKHLLDRDRRGMSIDLAAIPDNDSDFRGWVAEARRDGMDNDDTTICLVQL